MANQVIDHAPAVRTGRGEDVPLDEALNCLGKSYPQQAKIVELRYFGGLTHQEIGHVLGVSVPTVTRGWRMARAWLYRSLTEDSLTEDSLTEDSLTASL